MRTKAALKQRIAEAQLKAEQRHARSEYDYYYKFGHHAGYVVRTVLTTTGNNGVLLRRMIEEEIHRYANGENDLREARKELVTAGLIREVKDRSRITIHPTATLFAMERRRLQMARQSFADILQKTENDIAKIQEIDRRLFELERRCMHFDGQL